MHGVLGGFELDHVLFGGDSLEEMETAFAEDGLFTEYGGPHGNGRTHNAVLGFTDGSYLELIAPIDRDRRAPRRDDLLRGNAGPCGWALETSDIADAVDVFRTRGIEMDAPIELTRERPDGRHLRWKLAFPGDFGPGTFYPFLIEDITPRTDRIDPAAVTDAPELTGLSKVLLGVQDRDVAYEKFTAAFGPLPDPEGFVLDGIEATVSEIPETVLGLVSDGGSGPLGSRTDAYGQIPRSFLIGTADFDRSIERFSISNVERYLDDRLAWLDVSGFPPASIGLLDGSDPSG